MARLHGRLKTRNRSYVYAQVVFKAFIKLIQLPDACDPPNDEDYANGLRKQQLVIEFNENIWRVSFTVCSHYLSDTHTPSGGD